MTRRNGLLSTLALVAVGAVVGTMVVACGIRPSAVIHGWEAPRGAVSSLIVYLVDHNALRAVSRPLPASTTQAPKTTFVYSSPQDDALRALADGPTSTEAAGGLTTEIPANTAIAFKYAQDGNNYVFAYAPDRKDALSQRAVDQIACTAIASFTNDGSGNDQKIQIVVVDGARVWPKQGCPAATP